MVEGARLESVYTATYRGFESLLLRQNLKKGPDGPFFDFAGVGGVDDPSGSTNSCLRQSLDAKPLERSALQG